MSVAPATPPASPLPRYRGFRGAFVFGMFSLLGVLAIGGAGSAYLWYATGNLPVAMHMAGRVLLLALTAGGGAFLGRYWCGWAGDKLLTVRLVRGDVAVLGGLILAVLLPGYLMKRYPAYFGGKPTGQVELGQPVELSGPTLDGKEFNLANLKGKVVLVDFWATWCLPCVEEMPFVKNVHEKYRAAGLEVVGVSLDSDRTALTNFVAQHKLDWPQIFIEGDPQKPFDNPLAKRYGVDGIPCILVIDREGRLIARGMRRHQIEAEVARALGESVPWNIRLASLSKDIADWIYLSVMMVPWWLLIACGLGGTAGIAMVEATVYRLKGPQHA
jgi:thiol-disulfide isomerase/thioredoxin